MPHKNYHFHPIAEMYPRMSRDEFNNLIGSMEERGFDSSHPIVLFEGKILDGINRYLASKEANVTPVFIEFEGTIDEAIIKSRDLNAFRRHLSSSQKAMIAAKEVVASRVNNGVKITVKNASAIYATSLTYVKQAMQILEKNDPIAKLVFNGSMNIKEALYRIEEIVRLEQPRPEFDFDSSNNMESYDGITSDTPISQSEYNNIVELVPSLPLMASRCTHLPNGQNCPLLQIHDQSTFHR